MEIAQVSPQLTLWRHVGRRSLLGRCLRVGRWEGRLNNITYDIKRGSVPLALAQFLMFYHNNLNLFLFELRLCTLNHGYYFPRDNLQAELGIRDPGCWIWRKYLSSFSNRDSNP